MDKPESSSIGGIITFPLGTLYHGTKFAVEGLSEALRYEMKTIGVKVKIVEPGMVMTDFGGRSFDFSNDESLIEYQNLIQDVFTWFGRVKLSIPQQPIIQVNFVTRQVKMPKCCLLNARRKMMPLLLKTSGRNSQNSQYYNNLDLQQNLSLVSAVI